MSEAVLAISSSKCTLKRLLLCQQTPSTATAAQYVELRGADNDSVTAAFYKQVDNCNGVIRANGIFN